jgi:hypothetical protein
MQEKKLTNLQHFSRRYFFNNGLLRLAIFDPPSTGRLKVGLLLSITLFGFRFKSVKVGCGLEVPTLEQTTWSCGDRWRHIGFDKLFTEQGSSGCLDLSPPVARTQPLRNEPEKSWTPARPNSVAAIPVNKMTSLCTAAEVFAKGA